jgi:hypothetical protein
MLPSYRVGGSIRDAAAAFCSRRSNASTTTPISVRNSPCPPSTSNLLAASRIVECSPDKPDGTIQSTTDTAPMVGSNSAEHGCPHVLALCCCAEFALLRTALIQIVSQLSGSGQGRGLSREVEYPWVSRVRIIQPSASVPSFQRLLDLVHVVEDSSGAAGLVASLRRLDGRARG